MWWASVNLFIGAPVFGIGTGAYQVETQKLVASGKAAPDTADFDHPHSDYFDALSSRGLVGLLAFLLLLGVPAWLYTANLDSRDPHRMGAALGGLLVAVGFAIFRAHRDHVHTLGDHRVVCHHDIGISRECGCPWRAVDG